MHDAIERAITACRIRDGYTATPEETTAALRAIGRALDALATADRVLAGRAGRREAVESATALTGYAVVWKADGTFLTTWDGFDKPIGWSDKEPGEAPEMWATREAAQRVADHWSDAVVVEIPVAFVGSDTTAPRAMTDADAAQYEMIVAETKAERDDARREVERLREELAKRDACIAELREIPRSGCPCGQHRCEATTAVRAQLHAVLSRHTAGFGQVTP